MVLWNNVNKVYFDIKWNMVVGKLAACQIIQHLFDIKTSGREWPCDAHPQRSAESTCSSLFYSDINCVTVVTPRNVICKRCVLVRTQTCILEINKRYIISKHKVGIFCNKIFVVALNFSLSVWLCPTFTLIIYLPTGFGVGSERLSDFFLSSSL